MKKSTGEYLYLLIAGVIDFLGYLILTMCLFRLQEEMGRRAVLFVVFGVLTLFLFRSSGWIARRLLSLIHVEHAGESERDRDDVT
jgi:hypothetical protein